MLHHVACITPLRCAVLRGPVPRPPGCRPLIAAPGSCPNPGSYGEGCNGGDVIDVVRYMKHYGLPDESCMVKAVEGLCASWPGLCAGWPESYCPTA